MAFGRLTCSLRIFLPAFFSFAIAGCCDCDKSKPAQGSLNQSGAVSPSPLVIKALTPGQIGMIDERMRLLLSEQAQLEHDLNSAKAVMSDAHPKVLQLRRSLDAQTARVDAYATEWKQLQMQIAARPNS